MCYAYNPANASFGSALGRQTGIATGTDSSLTDTLKANQRAYMAANAAWTQGGMQGPAPVNANTALYQNAIAASQANRATLRGTSGPSRAIARFG